MISSEKVSVDLAATLSEASDPKIVAKLIPSIKHSDRRQWFAAL